MVLVFVARRTLDGEVALDITAERFAQAFRGRRSLRGSTHAEQRAWLLTIARRQIARYLAPSRLRILCGTPTACR
jgi:RNA polymerase sigma-70 factor (ECF subfamily)